MHSFGLVGHPLSHSLSKVMHEAAYSALDVEASYNLFDVPPEGIDGFFEDVAPGLSGFNVTIPHKQSVIPFLTAVDEASKVIGAVNTVAVEDNGLVGYNTDAGGFGLALLKEGVDVGGCDVVVVGAGGAARAVVYQLVKDGAVVRVVNRTVGRAQQLAGDLGECLGADIAYGGLESVAGFCGSADVLVNATSVGMHPHVDDSPVPASVLHPRMTVVDIVYNPKKTRLLQEAESKGCKVVGGAPMLVHQGALALEMWLQKKPPVDVMAYAVDASLG